MSLPPTTPAPVPDPASAQNLDAAASNADAREDSGDVGSPVASCPPAAAAKPSQGPASGATPGPGPRTFIEILVTDEDDKPVANQKYRLHLTDGSKQEGKLDSSGRIYLSSIPAGICDLMFLEMLDFGVPDEEVKRSWDWKASQGDAPKHVKDLHFDDSKGESLTVDDSTGEADETDAPAGADSPQPDDSADEED